MTTAKLDVIVDANGIKTGTKSLDDLAKAGADAEKSTKGVTSATNTLVNAARTLAGALVVRELVSYTDRWTDLNSKLVNATGSQQAADAAMQGLSQTARTTYSSLEATAASFLRNNQTLKELGYSTAAQINLSDALNNSLVISGTKGAQAESVMNALSKAMALGKLSGENFNTVIMSGGRTVEALADGLGVGTLELRRMAEEGLLTTSAVFDSLTSQMETLREEAEAMPATIGDAFGQLGNAVFEFVGRTDQAIGATASLAGELVSVADSIRALANDGARMNSMLRDAENLAIASGVAIGAVGTVYLAQMAAGLTRASAAQAAFNVLAKANPYVMLATGLATLTFGLLEYVQRQDDATDSLTRFKNVSSELAGMTGIGITQSIETASHNIRVLEKQISDLNAKALEDVAKYGSAAALINAPGIERLTDEVERQNEVIRMAKARRDELINQQLDEMFLREAGAVADAAVEIGAYSDKTLLLIDQLENEQKALTMTTREQEMFAAELRALANGDGPEAIATVRRLAGENYDLAESLNDAETASKELREALEEQSRTAVDLIATYRANIQMLSMTAREQEIYTASLAAGESASIQTRLALMALAGTYYDLNEAQGVAKAAAEEHARASKQAAEDSQRNWQDFEDAFADTAVDLYVHGNNAFDALAKSFEAMIVRMLAKKALLTGANWLGIDTGSVFSEVGGTSGLSSLSSLAKIPGLDRLLGNTGLGDISKGLGFGSQKMFIDDAGNGVDVANSFNAETLLSGLKTMGLSIGAGWAGGKVGNKLGESLFSKEAESSIGRDIGTALGTAVGGPLGALVGSTFGSMIDVAAGGDGYTRQNAGFLVGPTPGAKSEHTFEVDRFDSGLNVTGFARREDRAAAEAVLNGFRGVDSTVTALVKALGGGLSVTSLNGLNQEATPGSAGTYLGSGRDADLVGQMNSFVDQLADNVTGLDDALLQSIRSAGTAEETIRILTEAVDKKSLADKEAAKLAGFSKEQIRETIAATLASSRSEYEAYQKVSKMAAQYGLGLDGIAIAMDSSVSDLERWIHRVTGAHHSYASSLQGVAAEIERQQRLSMGLTELADSFRFDRMSDQEKLAFTQAEFEQTLKSAMGGDDDAAELLRQAASDYAAQAGRADITVSAYEQIMDDILRGLDAAAGAVSGVGALMSSVKSLVNQSMAAGQSREYIANVLASLGTDAVQAGDSYIPGLSSHGTSDDLIRQAVNEIRGSSATEYDAVTRIADAAATYGVSIDRVMDVMGVNGADSRRYKGMIDGSHRTGLDYVPFDGYRAELHEGERVQTKSQARAQDADLAGVLKGLDSTLKMLMRTPPNKGQNNKEVVAAIERQTSTITRIADRPTAEVTG